MSYRIESSVTIQAPVELVWTIIQDASRRLEWDERITEVQVITPPPTTKGSKNTLRYRMFGMEMRGEIEYVTWVPPYKSAVKGKLSGDTIGASWHFVSNDDGSTTWTTKLMLKSEPGRFAWLREQVYGRVTERLTKRSQQNFKRLVEAEHYAAQGIGQSVPSSI